MQEEKITREEILEKISLHRKALEHTLGRIPRERYLSPVFVEGWTIKDLIAHIAAWEQRMIAWIAQAAEGVLPDIPGTDQAVAAINEQLYKEYKDLPLKKVLEDFSRSFQQVVSLVEETGDDVLFFENYIEGRERPYWITVAANTWWHYQEHEKDLSHWIDENLDMIQ